MNKMIVLPLVFMLIIGIFGMVFDDSGDYSDYGSGSLTANPRMMSGSDEGWYDAGGRLICYENFTLVDGIEEGEIRHVTNFDFEWVWCNYTVTGSVAFWADPLNLAGNQFPLYNTPAGESSFEDAIFGFFVGGQLGFLGILFILMLIASIVGIHILGSGISDVSVGTIVKCSAFIGLFVVCTMISYDLVLAIPFGSVLYFILTAVYTLGVISQGGVM